MLKEKQNKCYALTGKIKMAGVGLANQDDIVKRIL